jgi:hypothetical protein
LSCGKTKPAGAMSRDNGFRTGAEAFVAGRLPRLPRAGTAVGQDPIDPRSGANNITVYHMCTMDVRHEKRNRGPLVVAPRAKTWSPSTGNASELIERHRRA